jgi:hypothetical protein
LLPDDGTGTAEPSSAESGQVSRLILPGANEE